MNEIKALHTAARRYCLDRFDFWARRYSEIDRAGGARVDGMLGDYTQEALATFPRYNVLRAIRETIEAIRWEDHTVEDLRQQIVDVGWTANDAFTERSEPDVAAEVMNEERRRFSDFVRNLSPSELTAIEPLPYRRSLSEVERRSIRQRLEERWAIDGGYWYPIQSKELPDDVLANVIAFQARHFESEVGAYKVQKILRSHGVDLVWELREIGPDLEIELSLLDLLYAQERFWIAAELDWVVYVSHESSITIGGFWLIREIKRIWPDCQKRIYVDWDYE